VKLILVLLVYQHKQIIVTPQKTFSYFSGNCFLAYPDLSPKHGASVKDNLAQSERDSDLLTEKYAGPL